MYETVIVGAGPGGTGPLIWAAQHGQLPDWLSSGVALVDQAPSIGGSLHRYTITRPEPCVTVRPRLSTRKRQHQVPQS